MPIGNANIHIQINVSEFINKIVSFLFGEFYRVTSRKKQKYFFRTFIFSNPQIEILVSFSRSTKVNVNMSFPKSNFEGNFSTYVFGKSFWPYRDLKSECWTSRHLIYKKILTFSYVWRLEFFLKKWNMYESHIFERPLQQTCRLETTLLCLCTRLRLNKKFQKTH